MQSLIWREFQSIHWIYIVFISTKYLHKDDITEIQWIFGLIFFISVIYVASEFKIIFFTV